MYNKSLTTPSTTRHDNWKLQAQQISTIHKDSLEKELGKTLLAKIDSSVGKYSPCLRIKLSDSQSLFLVGVITIGLLSYSTQQLRSENADVRDLYLTSLDAAGKSPSLFVNQNAKVEERGNRALFTL